MTPRERLISALERKEPDRLPVDLGSTATSTITREPYMKLREYLGLPRVEPRILSFTAQSVRPDEDILSLFKIDTRGIKPGGPSSFSGKVTVEGDYEWYYDESGIGSRRPRDRGLYFDLSYHPLKEKSAADIEAAAFPRGDDPGRIRGLREECEKHRSAGYPTILSPSVARGIIHQGTALLGFEDYFTRLYLEPEVIEKICRKILETKLAFYESVLNEIGDVLDVVTEGDDLGIQRGPFISPEIYRKMYKPLQAELFSEIKRRAPHIKIFYHSCGSVVEFIPDLIEIGVDALNPVQVSAFGMDPGKLKREYGKDICFWGGGIDTQNVLPNASPAKIKDEIKKLLDIWVPGGGYVFATVHNIQADVPPENVKAVFDALEEFR